MKQTTIRMHMNPEESLGTVGHVIDKDCLIPHLIDT